MSTGAGLPEARALLVVESSFGNTAAIGQAVAQGLSQHATVEVVHVDHAPDDLPPGIELLVVGAPTHAFSLSRESTRRDAESRRDSPKDTGGEASRDAAKGDGSAGKTGSAGAEAAEQADPDAVRVGRGLRDWLQGLPRLASPRQAAAFDTKVAKPRLPGSAATAAGKRLRRRGFRLTTSPRSFYVEGTEGPLVLGEEARAREWGQELGEALSRTTTVR